MSQIVVNIPGCEKVSTSSATNGTITIAVSDCTPPPPTNMMVPAFWVSAVLVLVTIVAFAIVRFRANELKPERMEQARLSRQQEINGQVEMAKAQKTCPSCTSKFSPELTKK